MGRVKSKNKKNKRGTLGLGSMFEAYIFLMGFALVIWGIISYFAFNVLINIGAIYPANYAEYRINEVFEQIETANQVTEDIIPDVCPRTDEYVVLQYRLKPQYKSLWMNEHMPNPEILLLLFVLFCCIGIMQIFAKRFGYRIRKKMAPMRGALVQIGDRNLDFEINYSGVREIDECLVALDDMRYALKTSLQKQWETEQEKNRQMSALAHDIKTPLTVVRGNSELLLETELTDEQKNYADYISGSVLQIQNYVQTLIEVTKSQEGISQAPVNVNVYDVLADIKKQTLGLSEVYQHQINWKEELESENSDSVISVVYDHVVRAVMNVVRNAAEHTPKGSVINITVTYSDGELAFTVEDSGSGFTPEGLAHGTEQFFMDDSSRTGGSHYGIGLFFAKKVAEEHGGKIVLANSNETSGAKVEISFTSQ